MAGSLSWHVYKTDDGATWALKQDTSNAGTAGAAQSPINTRTLPRGVKPRYALYKSQDGLISKKLYVPTNVSPAASTPSFVTTDGSGANVTLSFAGYFPEKERLSGFNTGQTA
jgi:hypothetical protein